MRVKVNIGLYNYNMKVKVNTFLRHNIRRHLRLCSVKKGTLAPN